MARCAVTRAGGAWSSSSSRRRTTESPKRTRALASSAMQKRRCQDSTRMRHAERRGLCSSSERTSPSDRDASTHEPRMCPVPRRQRTSSSAAKEDAVPAEAGERTTRSASSLVAVPLGAGKWRTETAKASRETVECSFGREDPKWIPAKNLCAGRTAWSSAPKSNSSSAPAKESGGVLRREADGDSEESRSTAAETVSRSGQSCLSSSSCGPRRSNDRRATGQDEEKLSAVSSAGGVAAQGKFKRKAARLRERKCRPGVYQPYQKALSEAARRQKELQEEREKREKERQEREASRLQRQLCRKRERNLLRARTRRGQPVMKNVMRVIVGKLQRGGCD